MARDIHSILIAPNAQKYTHIDVRELLGALVVAIVARMKRSGIRGLRCKQAGNPRIPLRFIRAT